MTGHARKAIATEKKKRLVIIRSMVASDGRVWEEARNDLARTQDISIWPLMVAWPAGAVLGLSVAFF